MSDSVRLLFEQLGISLLLGILVGLQRERSDSAIAGLRTFPLITMLGTLVAATERSLNAGGWLIAAGFLGVVAVVVVTNLYRLRQDPKAFGTTTEAAILLMYFVGAYLVTGERVVAIAVGAAVAVLLQFKPELHGIVARLGDEDVRAIMTFVLITGVILPVLPNTTYDLAPPLNVLNPFEIWMMVVLIVGISLGGYLIYKLFGRSAGILLGGILGGAISSTATTLSYARRTRTAPESARMAALIIMIASSVVFVRVMLEICVVAPQHFRHLAPPIAVMFGAATVAGVLIWLRLRREPAQLPEQKNPTELRSAFVFAALYAGVLMALAATKNFLGGQGLYGVAVLSGLTDMDAITLSTTRMVKLGTDDHGISAAVGWRLIVVASMANLLFKWCIAALVGHGKLRWRLAVLFAVPFATGCALLWLWPA
jgi:uncharacterized membrane protein (DUF4010 family)